MTVTPNGPNGAFTAIANLTPAYRDNPALVSWTRRLDFAARKLTVRDAFQLGAGTAAFFQVNTPVQPVVSGRVATAGRLRINVLEPSNATLSVRSWNALDAGEFTTGWRLQVAGGTTGYLVEFTEI
ncbi:MAG: hypothetical protein LH470_00180 [Lysobacter sp.]|nr:hypothetical protein [Lysobacter sp.]